MTGCLFCCMLSILNVCLIYAVYSIGLSDNLITGRSERQASVCVCVCKDLREHWMHFERETCVLEACD